jgi:hypothetical protein
MDTRKTHHIGTHLSGQLRKATTFATWIKFVS